MRLVCPNCEAKYEVPEDAIPETGRDVQCANCGHAWYQMRPRAAGAEPAALAPAVAAAAVAPPEPVAEPEPVPAAGAPEPKAPSAEVPVVSEPEPVTGPEDAATVVEPVAAPAEVPVPETVSEAVAEPAPVSEPSVGSVAPVAERQPDPAVVAPEAPATGEGVADSDDDAAIPEAASASAAAAPAAYAVDDSVLAILREEAEREAQARRAEAARPLEVQQDLGIDAAVAAPVSAPAVAAGAAAAVAAAALDEATDRVAGRRTRLPDVEEINSTLRPSEPPSEETVETAAPVEVEGRSSFRSGFLLVLTVAILASALYISADALARAVPALAGVLESYVSFIDGLRLRMDGLMQSATVAINGSGG